MCPGILSCRELYPHDPKYWCEDCINDTAAEAECRCEGDR